MCIVRDVLAKNIFSLKLGGKASKMESNSASLPVCGLGAWLIAYTAATKIGVHADIRHLYIAETAQHMRVCETFHRGVFYYAFSLKEHSSAYQTAKSATGQSAPTCARACEPV